MAATTQETLARRLRLVLGAEVAAYVALGAWLCVGRGWGLAAAIGVPVLIAVAWRLAFILVTYALAWRNRSPTPPEFRRSVFALLPHVLRETAAWTAGYAALQPFVRVFMGDGRAPCSRGARLPVLLVHGYVSNRGLWWVFRRALEARGETVWAVTLEPVYGSIDSLVDPLAARIDELLATTGAQQVVLVTHSMGGLVARAYLRDHGAAKVARLVTLGAPHHGSVHAYLGAGANARAMEPGSPWLEALGRSEARGFLVPFTSIFSHHDNFVAPQTSSVHPAARNVPLAGIGHVSLAFSARVLALISAELDAANAAGGGEPDKLRSARSWPMEPGSSSPSSVRSS
ncbi:MAG: esterase/lipase family protein [Burkholderiales bacterium]